MVFRPTLARLAPQKLDKWLLRQYRDPEVRKHLGLKTAYRGAYTLLQLNQNYERFLNKKHITAAIDLAAHPGTWSQVVAGKLGWCPEPPKARYLEKSGEKAAEGEEGKKEEGVSWSTSVPTQFPSLQVVGEKQNTHTSVLLPSNDTTQPMAAEPQEEALTVDTSAVVERRGNPPLPPPLFFKPDIIHAATMEPASSVAAGSSKLGTESIDFSTPKPLGKGHGAVIAVDTKKIRSIHSVQTVRADWTLPETSTLVEGLLAGVNKQSKADFILLDCTIESAAAKIASDYNAAACHLYCCRGHQFEDNTLNVKTFTPGQSIHFLVDIVVRHTGRANVSVVDLKTQKMIGTPLFNWPVYADNNLGPADWVKNETDFTVVLPDLGTPCQQAGACAIQWWWYATSNKQTYQSCVDFGTP